MNVTISNPSTVPFELELQAAKASVRAAFADLNRIAETGDQLYDLTSHPEPEIKIHPAVIAHLLCIILHPWEEKSDAFDFSYEQKAYWLGVAEQMGEDGVEDLRKVVAYMAKVQSFK